MSTRRKSTSRGQLLPVHPQRLASIAEWHHRQLADDDPGAAVIAVTLTRGGMVRTSVVGVEPEFAASMLEGLARAQARLVRLMPPAADERRLRIVSDSAAS